MSSSTKQPEVVTDENVEQQFLWLTNTAGNQLAELTGGVSSTSSLDQRAVDVLRSIEEVAGKLAERYEADAVPGPIKADRQHYGLVAPQEDDQKFKDAEDKQLEKEAEKIRLDAEKDREKQANEQAKADAEAAKNQPGVKAQQV